MKCVMLNSGGFDSIVLMKELVDKGFEPLSLFFRYGQKNCLAEEACVRNMCLELNLPLKVIDIPKIDWSSNDFYGNSKEHDAQYLELRNLIFLSYALSYAQGQKCDKVFLAILEGGEYSDTKPEFVQKVNELSNTFGIDVITPFIDLNKYDLGRYAIKYKIKDYEFFSCNTPKIVDGTLVPCGECNDCLTLKEVYATINSNMPVHSWFENDMQEFSKRFRSYPIEELRALINNQCQFDCHHCFYGFKDTKSPCMSYDQWCNVIDQAYSMGIKKIHFSGKEPLYNDFIFDLIKYMQGKYSDMKYDLVTNGVNVAKYKNELKAAGPERIFLSVDNLADTVIRPTGNHLINTIHTIQELGITVQIFLDVHRYNYNDVVPIMKALISAGIKEFYVRAILPLGHDREGNLNVTPLQYDNVIWEVVNAFKENEEVEISIHTALAYTQEYIENGSYFTHGLIDAVKDYHLTNIVGGIHIIPEFYCGPFESQVTVTPDGYVLGCATEVSSPSYEKVATGNVLNDSLEALIKKGKENTINRMTRHLSKCEGCYNIKKCYHTN